MVVVPTLLLLESEKMGYPSASITGLDEFKKVLGYSLVVKIKQSAFVLSK